MKSSLATMSPQNGEAKRREGASAALTRSVQDQLGDRLRAMYDHLKTDTVPDSILELLQHLEKPNERHRS